MASRSNKYRSGGWTQAKIKPAVPQRHPPISPAQRCYWANGSSSRNAWTDGYQPNGFFGNSRAYREGESGSGFAVASGDLPALLARRVGG